MPEIKQRGMQQSAQTAKYDCFKWNMFQTIYERS